MDDRGQADQFERLLTWGGGIALGVMFWVAVLWLVS